MRILALLAAATAAAPAPAQTLPAPPVAPVIARTDTMHGDVRVDNYFWLRDRSNPEVISYLEAENRYTDSVMAPTRQLQETLYQEMLGRIKQTDTDVPDRMGPYLYYSRTVEGQQYPIYARRRGSMEAPEEVILDQNQMAQGKRYFSLGAYTVSPDHRLLAFSVDTTGSEHFTLMVKNLETGEILPERVDSLGFGATWAADNRTLFYTKTDDAHRPDRIFRHTLGTPPSQDQLVFHEPDVLFRVGIYRTKDDAYLVLSSGSFTTSEAWVLPANRPNDPFRVVSPRQKDVLYAVNHQNGRFVIRTNAGGANNFKLVTAPESDPSRANWTDLVPHRETVLLDGFDVFRDHLVLYERTNALRQIRVRDIRSSDEHVIAFEEPVYTAGPGSNPEYNTTMLRFGYQSMVTPSSVYDYDMATRRRELRKQNEVLGGYDPSQYATERTWARASDGTMVPVSLVYRKPFERDGAAPHAAVRVRLLRQQHRSHLLQRQPEPAGPRGGLRHRAHPRRAGDGPLLVRPGEDAQQAQHLHRLHRGGGAPGARAVHRQRAPGHPRRQRRRAADGRGGEHAPRPVQGGRGRRAVRGRDQHHGRRQHPAHGGRVGAVGQPGQRGRVPLHALLLAVRQRGAQGVPHHAGDHGAERPARGVLGAGQVGRAGCGRTRRTTTCSCCAPTWARATAARPAATTRCASRRSATPSSCTTWTSTSSPMG